MLDIIIIIYAPPSLANVFIKWPAPSGRLMHQRYMGIFV